MRESQIFDAEMLALWYFRLNGFMTIPNFVVHPDLRGSQLSDIDVIGVRFPYRAEQPADPMPDDERFANSKHPLIILAEIKRAEAEFNASWLDQKSRVMERALGAIGAFRQDRVDEIAIKLRKSGRYEDDGYIVCWVGVGGRAKDGFAERFKRALFVSWSDVAAFLFSRFDHYDKQKRDSSQWDKVGRKLFEVFRSNRHDREGFKGCLSHTFQLGPE